MVSCLSVSTLTWIWTIRALRKYTKNSEELLPNKWIFTLHFVLLILYLSCQILAIIAFYRWQDDTGQARTTWGGIYNVSYGAWNLFQTFLFALSIHMMLPLTKKQKMKRKDFEKYLFLGFSDRNELENTIHERYPKLPFNAR